MLQCTTGDGVCCAFAPQLVLIVFVLAFTLANESVPTSPCRQVSSSAARDVPSTSSHYRYYNHNEVDRFMAAVQTVENFAVSCMSTGFGISVNRKYIGELVGIYLKHATAAVDQLSGNIARYSTMEVGKDSDSFRSSIIEETNRLLMNIVEHAAMLHDCIESGNASQVPTEMFQTVNNLGNFCATATGVHID